MDDGVRKDIRNARIQVEDYMRQTLRIDGLEVDPDCECPECGKPWKKGASYGHQICCGCPVCGYSKTCFDGEIYAGSLTRKRKTR